jgi:hypothetical protein
LLTNSIDVLQETDLGLDKNNRGTGIQSLQFGKLAGESGFTSADDVESGSGNVLDELSECAGSNAARGADEDSDEAGWAGFESSIGLADGAEVDHCYAADRAFKSFQNIARALGGCNGNLNIGRICWLPSKTPFQNH